MAMKIITAVLLSVMLLTTSSVMASESSKWTGWLTDEKCAANGAKASHKGCAMKCVESGQAMVFVADDKKVYKLQGTEKVDKIKSLLGDKVVLNGSLKGDTITVTSVKLAQ